MKKLALCALALFVAMGAASLTSAATLQDKIDKDNSPPAGGPRGLLDCTDAIEASCDYFYAGDTSFGVNNAENYSCHGFSESGPELVFSLTLGTQSLVSITMAPSGCDLDLQLLSGCDEGLCFAFSAGVSTEFIEECLEPGTYYIVVDGYGGAACPFTLDIQCADCAEPVGGETCDTCTDLDCGDVNLVTNTTGANNDYDPLSGNPCTGYSASGGDIVMCLCIPAYGGVHLQFSEDTYDASIYLVTDCGNLVGTCLDGDDCFPNPCVDYIDYDNPGPADVNAYLIVDGFGGSVGQGTLSGTLDCCEPVPTIQHTWGTLKAQYR
jgi:hypothetical protein